MMMKSSSRDHLHHHHHLVIIIILFFISWEFLVLNCLPCLTSFHSGNYALEFPKLSSPVVGNCPKMSNFCDHVTVTAPKLDTFMYTSYVDWRLKTELNSNDHVQVDYQVFKKDNMYIEEFIKEGGDKYTYGRNSKTRYTNVSLFNSFLYIGTLTSNLEKCYVLYYVLYFIIIIFTSRVYGLGNPFLILKKKLS